MMQSMMKQLLVSLAFVLVFIGCKTALNATKARWRNTSRFARRSVFWWIGARYFGGLMAYAIPYTHYAQYNHGG